VTGTAVFRSGLLAGQVAVITGGGTGIGFGIAEVVDGDDLDLVVALALVQRAQHVSTDSAITIDGDLDCHEHCLDWEKKGCPV